MWVGPTIAERTWAATGAACRVRVTDVYCASMSPAPFTSLAGVYDAIMEDVEYDDWVQFVLELALERGWTEGPALDLGCGTGNATAPMAARGIAVEGLDASEAMLAVARAKLPGVPFHLGDFRRLALPHPFTLVYSVFDALNNMLRPSEFAAMARGVRRHLAPGGLFVFDVNTTVGLRDLWEGGCAEGWVGDVHYRWLHTFDEARRLATVEAYCETPSGSFTEVHHERPYDADELVTLLQRAGLRQVEALTYPSGRAAPDDAARLWVVARRP